MAEEVGQQGKVAMLFQEVLGVSVPEGVWVDHGGVDSVFLGIEGKSAGDSACRYTLSISVQEQIAAIPVQPLEGFLPELAGDVQATDFAAFGVDVEEARAHILDLELDQFAHSGTGGGHVPDDEIPFRIGLLPESALQKLVIFVADYVLRKGTLLNLDRLKTQVFLPDPGQIFVDGMDSQIDGRGFETVDKDRFVSQQVPLAQLWISSKIVLYGIQICHNRVFGMVFLPKHPLESAEFQSFVV